MTPTQGEHAQTEALFYASALENCAEVDFDRIFVPAAAVIRRLHAQVAALTAPPAQPAAPQCVAYAELDDAFESWLEDQDVDRLSDGYESWLNSVRSCWDSALRASHGQAPAGAADEMEINRPFEDPAPPFNQWRGEMQSALKRAGVYAARSPGAGNKLTLRWRTTREDVLPTPTAQAAPAAGVVAVPVGYALAYRNGELIFFVNGLNLWPTLEQAQEASKLHLGAGDPVPVFSAAPTPAAQADSGVQEDAAREAVRKVLDMFPFNATKQGFSINGGPSLSADGDTEFYSVKKVLEFLTAIKTTLDAARKQGGTHEQR